MAKTEEQKAAEQAAKEQKKREEVLKELATLNITSTGGTETIAPLTGQETNEQLAELLKKAKADAKAAGGCACRKSNPVILMMQSSEDWIRKNTP
jgi:hypothetical protein